MKCSKNGIVSNSDVQIPSDLFSQFLTVSLGKQIQESAGEVVSVGVWITQLVANRVQEQISTWMERKR